MGQSKGVIQDAPMVMDAPSPPCRVSLDERIRVPDVAGARR